MAVGIRSVGDGPRLSISSDQVKSVDKWLITANRSFSRLDVAIAMTVGEYDAVVTRFFSAELCDDSAADESTSLCGAFASDLMAID